jgi:cyanate lyase
MLSRQAATEKVLAAKEKHGLTFEEIAAGLGRHEVWLATALLGQATMSSEEAGKVGKLLELEPEVIDALQQVPHRGAYGGEVPVDPLLYRFFEIIQVFGPAMKAVIHEKFGDGIMSAIDFEMDIKRLPDPKGDRVLMTMNGKFLPYRKW